MNCTVIKVILVAFVLCALSKSCESLTLDYKSYVEYGNRTLLGRVRRQAQGQTCNGDSSKFQCATTTDCIDEDSECNGTEDCPDGSDEKESLCKNIPCPGYLFKCDYGACISVDQKCDGEKNCIDNSDEVNCPVSNKINSNCRSDQFECANGVCIEIDGKCDGLPNCEDKSDETEELCLNIFCPGYTYKCKYGACVDGDSECNGKKNCIDNSDEDEKKCGQKPDYVPPVPSGKQCVTPKQPNHGYWTYLDGLKGAANRGVDSNTVITFACDQGFKLSTTIDPTLLVVCQKNGKWSLTVQPTCQKLCPSVYNTPLITVICKTDGSIVPCEKATDNTVLTYKCAPYYEPPHGSAQSSTCYDGTWDYTPQCIPACGEKRVSATPLIVNGREVERGNYPWVVALYSSKDSDPYFTNVCGGSLITVDIVLTAAHCVSKQDSGKVYPVRYYRVGAGKYYNQYEDERDNDTAQYSEVAEIVTHKEYKGDIQNFRGDIALLRLKSKFALSKVVQPVCYNNLPHIEPKTIGLVTGWGYTTQTGKPSEKLKELELPYAEEDQCRGELDAVDAEFTDRYFTPDKMCAGFYNHNTSVCKGDSGGGLVFRNPSYKNRFFIHGIVSLAHSYSENQQKHCDIQSRALFTRVETYIPWIQLGVRRWTASQVEIR